MVDNSTTKSSGSSNKGKLPIGRPMVPFQPKAKVVPSKVKTVGVNQLDLASDNRLKEAFVISFTDSGGNTSLTIHRPIGVTRLPSDVWIATPSGDVQYLLERVANPNQRDLDEKRKALVIQLAIKEGVLKLNDQRVLCYPNGQERKPISDLLNRKDPKELQEVPKEHIEAEELFRKRAKEHFSKVAEEQLPDNFETLGGPLGTDQQVPIADSKGLSAGQARTLLMRRMLAL